MFVGVKRYRGCKASGAEVPARMKRMGRKSGDCGDVRSSTDKKVVETLHYHRRHNGVSYKRIT